MLRRDVLGPLLVVGASVVACATRSDVMDTGNGTYMISAHAAPVRGGAAGANKVAYADAKAFCQKKGGMHAVVIDANARDVYQASYGGTAGPSGGAFGGGVFAAGNVDMHFRCEN